MLQLSMIIDCHVHLSQFNHAGQSFSQIRDSLLSSMERQGISFALVFPDSEPDTMVADLDTTLELVCNYPKLLMLGTICIPLIDPSIVDKLDSLVNIRRIIGIKLYPGFELFHPEEGWCHAIYEVCIKHNIPVVFHSGETMNEPWREEYNHPYKIANVATQFPALKVIVAHFSQPHLTECREIVLSNPNVYADISGLAYPDVIRTCGKEAILHILEDVAKQQPKKILFGSDWPICDIEEHLRLVSSLPLSETTKNLILAGNAERGFRVREHFATS